MEMIPIRVVASIRGTQSGLDALRDLIIEPNSLQGGLVHSGMRDEANEVITKLKPLIDKAFLQYPDYHLVFTGHSLGAGAASIATLILQTSYPSIRAYCFACPSCISADLLPRLEDCVISVENMHDVVPRMNSSAMHKMYDLFANANWKKIISNIISLYRLEDSPWADALRYIEKVLSQSKSSIPDDWWRLNGSEKAESGDGKTILRMESRYTKNGMLRLEQTKKEMRSDHEHAKEKGGSYSWNCKRRSPLSPHFSMKSVLREYNDLNNEISLVYNNTRLYSEYRENEKKLIQEYRKSIDSLLSMYVENIQNRVNTEIERGIGMTDTKNLMDMSTGRDIVEYSSKKASLLQTSLIDRSQTLETELRTNRDLFLHNLQSINKPLLPSISTDVISATDSVSSFISLAKRFLLDPGTKKDTDWFPYPQLYPPGVILHLRNNPSSSWKDDYVALEEVKKRLTGNVSEFNVSGCELVGVDKSEFDHYSLESSLIDDHRMGNYVNGLLRIYDKKIFERSLE